jgi:hypothetical protein
MHATPRSLKRGDLSYEGTHCMARCEECNRKVDQPSRHLVNGRILCGIHDPRPPTERQTRDVPRERTGGGPRRAYPSGAGSPPSAPQAAEASSPAS